MAATDPAINRPFSNVPHEGPDGLAREIAATYGQGYLRPGDSPKLSQDALLSLIRIVYLASQQPNEGRFPRLKVFVPGESYTVQGMVFAIDIELTVRSLRRLGPVLEAPELCAIVIEREGVLCIVGIASRARGFTELTFGEPVLGDEGAAHGLYVEVLGPGDLRAGQYCRHRLVGGVIRQESSYWYSNWFGEWADEALSKLLGSKAEDNSNHASILGSVWDHLLWRIAGFAHGGCLLVLPDPSHPDLPIRRTFNVNPTCNLGAAFAQVYLTASTAWQNLENPDPQPITEEQIRDRLQHRQKLLSTIDATARLALTDGCLLFDRHLRLHSFGCMIEAVPSEKLHLRAAITCLNGNANDEVSEEVMATFGARRRSAIQICKMCPGALAFIVSQDGDLRAVVGKANKVRLYDDLTLWGG